MLYLKLYLITATVIAPGATIATAAVSYMIRTPRVKQTPNISLAART